MPTTTVQSIVTANAGTSAADLQPLLANDAFCSAANAELKTLDNTVAANAALNEKSENLVTAVHTFAGAMGNLRAISKRFPETSTYIAEAVKQVQLAMGVVKGNVPATAIPTRAGVPVPAASSAPIPGTWQPTVTYAVGNSVAYNGVVYTAIVTNANQVPPNTAFWKV